MSSGLAIAGTMPALRTPFNSRFDAELATVAGSLEEALHVRDLAIFYQAFRATSLPFLCGDYRDDPEMLFPACFEVVHRLGGISPAVALAVENHYYVTSAVATFSAVADTEMEAFRQRLLSAVVEQRLLVANTNSKIHGGRIGAVGTVAVRDGGGFRIDGEAAYASLATEADILVLLTEIVGEGFAIFVVPDLRDNPAIEIGEYLFPEAMLDSDTRRIRFRDLRLPLEALASAGSSLAASKLVPFEMAWHQALIAALYLGCAARSIDEARIFLQATNDRDGRPLAELDGMVVDMGRLALEYSCARSAVEKCANGFRAARELPRDDVRLEHISNLASSAKYTACRTAESIVATARRIVGARAFVGGSTLERLSNEVVFGSLGPEVSAVIERRFGMQVMKGGFFGPDQRH